MMDLHQSLCRYSCSLDDELKCPLTFHQQTTLRFEFVVLSEISQHKKQQQLGINSYKNLWSCQDKL